MAKALKGTRTHDNLKNAFAGVHLGTHRIHAHPDDWIAGQLPAEANVTLDRSGLRGSLGSYEANQCH